MEQRTLSQLFWQQALTGGLILGIALFVWDLAGYWLDLPVSNPGVASFVQFVLLAGGIFWFGRKLREQRGPVAGFSYGQAFGFVMALMLCAGVIYGAGQYFLQVVIAPEYYEEVFEASLLGSSLDENLIEQMINMREGISTIMRNPLVYLFSGIFTMVIYGGLVGLILCAFLKRPADPFAGDKNDYNPEV